MPKGAARNQLRAGIQKPVRLGDTVIVVYLYRPLDSMWSAFVTAYDKLTDKAAGDILQYAKIVDMAQGPAGGRSLTTHDALAAQLTLQQQRVLDARCGIRRPAVRPGA